MTLIQEDRLKLEAAHRLLENPGLAARITDVLGTPIEKGIALLPDGAQGQIVKATEGALRTALDAALLTIDDTPGESQWNLLHKGGVVITGAVGGAFGLPALLVELPIATTIMLRSIADIARHHGESISDPSTKSACLEVFAMGGTKASDDASESGYLAIRMLLARKVSEATKFFAKMTAEEASKSFAENATKKSAPELIRLISSIAERFGAQITNKAAAQLVPFAGAIGGATVNLLFMQHFQDMAQGHFTMRKLERKYGSELVWREYNRLGVAAKSLKNSQ